MSVYVTRSDVPAGFLCMCGYVPMWCTVCPPYGGQRSTLSLRSCSLGFCFVFFLQLCIVCACVYMQLGTCVIACMGESEDNLERGGFLFP